MKKILIIEDDSSIAELERDYLEINDFECEIAAKGTTGLEKARGKFDLIIIDIMLRYGRFWGYNGTQKKETNARNIFIGEKYRYR